MEPVRTDVGEMLKGAIIGLFVVFCGPTILGLILMPFVLIYLYWDQVLVGIVTLVLLAAVFVPVALIGYFGGRWIDKHAPSIP